MPWCPPCRPRWRVRTVPNGRSRSSYTTTSWLEVASSSRRSRASGGPADVHEADQLGEVERPPGQAASATWAGPRSRKRASRRAASSSTTRWPRLCRVSRYSGPGCRGPRSRVATRRHPRPSAAALRPAAPGRPYFLPLPSSLPLASSSSFGLRSVTTSGSAAGAAAVATTSSAIGGATVATG